MLEDLRDLNRRIAKHWLGEFTPEQQSHLALASLCVAQFALSATEFTQVLKDDTWNRRTWRSPTQDSWHSPAGSRGTPLQRDWTCT